MTEHQEVRTDENEKAVKVADITTGDDLETFFNQRGLYPWRTSQLVGSLSYNDMRYGLYLAHVADETGEGYVFWLDKSYRGRQIGAYRVNVRATHGEALAEARDLHDQAVRGEVSWQDPEWYGVPDGQQPSATTDQAIRDALEVCRRFRAFVKPGNSWEEIGMFASDRMQEIQWALEAVEDTTEARAAVSRYVTENEKQS